MSTRGDEADRPKPERPLKRMIRLVQDAAADRADASEEIREARRARLELLAEELAPVFADVPADDKRFDFVISSGLEPRLWIDATTHVALARDSRTYRLLRDTRLGRVVLAESDRLGPVAEAVTRYIAEQTIDRIRLLEGDVAIVKSERKRREPDKKAAQQPIGEYVAGVALVVLGMIAGAGILLVLLSDLLPELGIGM